MKKITSLIIISAAITLSCTETAGMAGAFLRYGLDARSESLGRAMTADVNSAYSIFFNPATASSVTEKQVLTGMKILSMDRKFAYLSYVHPVKNNAVISGGILYSGTDEIEGRDKNGDLFDTYSYNENMFYLNFGIRPKEYLSIGVTAKLIWARFPEFDSEGESVTSLTFAYDTGLNIFIPNYKSVVFGLTAKNGKGKNAWDSSKVWTDGTASTDYYPVTYSLGAAWYPEFNNEISVYSDINSDEFKEYGYGFGVEWTKKFEEKESAVSFRLGSVSGWLSAGFGYEFKLFSKKMIVDYSYTQEDISEFDPHSLSWRFFL